MKTKMKLSRYLLIIASTACLSSHATAQVGAPKSSDDRVERILRAAELKYEIDKDGDFKLINSLDAGRSQLVFINSNTSKLGTLEIRKVWSVGFVADDLTPAQLRKLLEANENVKLGAWLITKMSDKSLAIFSAQIAADTDKTSLLLALQAVTETADNMEKEITGKDDR